LIPSFVQYIHEHGYLILRQIVQSTISLICAEVNQLGEFLSRMLRYFILETDHEINPLQKKNSGLSVPKELYLRLKYMKSKLRNRPLTWAQRLCLPLNAALGEINRFPAPLAKVLSVELIRKDLFFFPAIGALTDK
jgi:hypothetical protein